MEQNKTLVMAPNLEMSMRFLPCACGIENAAAIVLHARVPTYPSGLLLTHSIPQAKQDQLLTTLTATLRALFTRLIANDVTNSVPKKQTTSTADQLTSSTTYPNLPQYQIISSLVITSPMTSHSFHYNLFTSIATVYARRKKHISSLDATHFDL